MSEWYARYLDISEGQDRTSHIRKGQVRKGPVWKVSGWCLVSVWQVSCGSLDGILWVSGGFRVSKGVFDV